MLLRPSTLLLLLILPASCRSAAQAVADADEVVAHRGNSSVAPENTLAAVRHSLSIEPTPQFIEIDLWAGADGALVVIHDDTTERTTGSPGVVKEMSGTALRQLDAGYSSEFGDAFRGERIPLLDEVLAAVAGRDCAIMIEIKDVDAAAPATELVRGRGELDAHLFASFEAAALERVRETDARAHLMLLSSEDTQASLATARALGCRTFGCSKDSFTSALAAEVHAADMELWVWTVNDPTRAAELLEGGADRIITDIPADLLR